MSICVIKKLSIAILSLLLTFSNSVYYAKNEIVFIKNINDVNLETNSENEKIITHKIDACKINSWYEFLNTMYYTFEISHPKGTYPSYDGLLDELRGRAYNKYYCGYNIIILNYNLLAIRNRDIAIFMYECFKHAILPCWDGEYDGTSTEFSMSDYGLPKKFNVYIEGDKLEEEHIYF